MSVVEFFQRLKDRPRLWRILVAAAFLVPVLLVLPQARSLVVRNAVITAYLSDFRSPIDGEVVNINLRPGATPAPGEPVIVLRNDRIDLGRLARLQAEDQAAQAELRLLQDSLASLRELEEERQVQVTGYANAIQRDLEVLQSQLREQEAALDAIRIAAESSLERVRRLHQDGLASASDLEAAIAAYESARTNQQSNREALRRIGLQWEEMQQGVFQLEVQEGVLFTRQMEQTLKWQMIELEHALQQAKVRQQAGAAELQRTREALEMQTHAEITLPEPKSVFDIYTSPGAWVEKGARILSAVDCSNLLVDIALDDALLQLVEPGQEVEVRTFGSFKRKQATVLLVRGSGALFDTPVLAAAVPDRGSRKGRVLARIESGPGPEHAFESCDIGRTAYAEFTDIGLFTLLFYPLFR